MYLLKRLSSTSSIICCMPLLSAQKPLRTPRLTKPEMRLRSDEPPPQKKSKPLTELSSDLLKNRSNFSVNEEYYQLVLNSLCVTSWHHHHHHQSSCWKATLEDRCLTAVDIRRRDGTSRRRSKWRHIAIHTPSAGGFHRRLRRDHHAAYFLHDLRVALFQRIRSRLHSHEQGVSAFTRQTHHHHPPTAMTQHSPLLSPLRPVLLSPLFTGVQGHHPGKVWN